jgi:hypothetical protein
LQLKCKGGLLASWTHQAKMGKDAFKTTPSSRTFEPSSFATGESKTPGRSMSFDSGGARSESNPSSR